MRTHWDPVYRGHRDTMYSVAVWEKITSCVQWPLIRNIGCLLLCYHAQVVNSLPIFLFAALYALAI